MNNPLVLSFQLVNFQLKLFRPDQMGSANGVKGQKSKKKGMDLSVNLGFICDGGSVDLTRNDKHLLVTVG